MTTKTTLAPGAPWPWIGVPLYQKKLYRAQRVDSKPLINMLRSRTGGVTVRQASMAMGITITAARERLERLVKNGHAKRLTQARPNPTQPIFYGVTE